MKHCLLCPGPDKCACNYTVSTTADKIEAFEKMPEQEPPTDLRFADYMKDVVSINTQPHYKGKDTLYKVAEDFGLNAWEFDILKRIVRCRHKGQFKEDLQKTKDLIDIYLKEYGEGKA